MKKTLLLTILAAACSKSDAPAKQDEAKLPMLTVDQVDKDLAANAQAVDANGDDTRKKMGVVPGAILLKGDDAVAQLPNDKSKELVFYCANTHCGASHEAAHKAVLAGWTNVKVMPEGIAGWVAAGKKVQQI